MWSGPEEGAVANVLTHHPAIEGVDQPIPLGVHLPGRYLSEAELLVDAVEGLGQLGFLLTQPFQG